MVTLRVKHDGINDPSINCAFAEQGQKQTQVRRSDILWFVSGTQVGILLCLGYILSKV